MSNEFFFNRRQSIFRNYQFEPDEIAVLNRWLYTARADGKPRVLILPADRQHHFYYAANAHNPFANVLNFINGNIKFVSCLFQKIYKINQIKLFP
jgi:hypothetical protein